MRIWRLEVRWTPKPPKPWSGESTLAPLPPEYLEWLEKRVKGSL